MTDRQFERASKLIKETLEILSKSIHPLYENEYKVELSINLEMLQKLICEIYDSTED